MRSRRFLAFGGARDVVQFGARRRAREFCRGRFCGWLEDMEAASLESSPAACDRAACERAGNDARLGTRVAAKIGAPRSTFHAARQPTDKTCIGPQVSGSRRARMA